MCHEKFAVADVKLVAAKALLYDFNGFWPDIEVFHPFRVYHCVCCEREWSTFILLPIAVQFSQHHLLKRVSFIHWMLFPRFIKD